MNMGYLIAILALIAFIVFVMKLAKSGAILRKKIEDDYRESLRGTDKAKALELGRKYYAMNRPDKKLTMYDEQALTNDLSTMKKD